MKIALVVPGGVDASGEVRVIPALLWLLERLASRYEMHVFALYQEPAPSRYLLCGATVQTIGRPWTRVRTMRAIIGEHRRRPFDLFHGFWATRAGAITVLLARLLRRPALVHLAGGELFAISEINYGGWRRMRSRLAGGLALAGASRVTAASTVIAQRARQLGRNVERVPLGVDLSRWPVRSPRRRDSAQPARLVQVASLNLVKDQHMLLRMAGRLQDSGLAFHLDVIGEDTLDGDVHRRANDLGVSDCVTFHGFVPHARLRPLVERADLMVVTSRHEAGPVVLLEAAVAGVPVVGTAVGQLRDWSPDAAVTVPVGDHEALAREVLGLLGDDDRRVRIAQQAQQRAICEDADWTARRFGALYDELVEGGVWKAA